MSKRGKKKIVKVPALPEVAAPSFVPAKPSRFGRILSFLRKPGTIFAILLAAGVWYAYATQPATKSANQTNEAYELVTKVGKLIELPSGETPTIATVTDVTKVKDQAFFVNAQNGDKLLIYPQAKKAILYRPSTNKVINVAPLVIGPTQPSRVVLYNGTSTFGITKDVEAELKAEVQNIEVIGHDNAGKRTYGETLVVDLTGNRATVAKQIADAIGGTVGALPEGEAKPEADILVIVGSDYKK